MRVRELWVLALADLDLALCVVIDVLLILNH